MPPAHICCFAEDRGSAAAAGLAVPGPWLAVPRAAGRVWWRIVQRHKMVHVVSYCCLDQCSLGTHLLSICFHLFPATRSHLPNTSPLTCQCQVPSSPSHLYKLQIRPILRGGMWTHYPCTLCYKLYSLLEPHSFSWMEATPVAGFHSVSPQAVLGWTLHPSQSTHTAPLPGIYQHLKNILCISVKSYTFKAS